MMSSSNWGKCRLRPSSSKDSSLLLAIDGCTGLGWGEWGYRIYICWGRWSFPACCPESGTQGGWVWSSIRLGRGLPGASVLAAFHFLADSTGTHLKYGGVVPELMIDELKLFPELLVDSAWEDEGPEVLGVTGWLWGWFWWLVIKRWSLHASIL